MRCALCAAALGDMLPHGLASRAVGPSTEVEGGGGSGGEPFVALAPGGGPVAPDLARGAPQLPLADLPPHARGPFPGARTTVAQDAVSALLGYPDVDVRVLPWQFEACLAQAVVKHHGRPTAMRLPREVLRCLAALRFDQVPWNGLVIPLRGALHARPLGVCCALMAFQRVFISALSQLRARFPASAARAAVPLPTWSAWFHDATAFAALLSCMMEPAQVTLVLQQMSRQAYIAVELSEPRWGAVVAASRLRGMFGGGDPRLASSLAVEHATYVKRVRPVRGALGRACARPRGRAARRM